MASGGMRDMIPTIARTAVVCGVDGIFMEVNSALPHPEPKQALCTNFCYAGFQADSAFCTCKVP